MFDVEAIDREIAELEKRYKQDREVLLNARAYALRSAFRPEIIPGPISTSPGPLPNGTIRPTREGKKTDRQLIREILAGWSGDFAIPELIAAAKRHEGSPAADIPKGVWTSTIFWLCQNRFLEVVKPRAGPKPGTYRIIVSRTEMLTPKRRKNKNQSPVQGAVLEAIRTLQTERFSKRELIEAVQATHPDRDHDVIGAVLHRLASHNIGARIVERNREGNIYEKL